MRAAGPQALDASGSLTWLPIELSPSGDRALLIRGPLALA